MGCHGCHCTVNTAATVPAPADAPGDAPAPPPAVPAAPAASLNRSAMPFPYGVILPAVMGAAAAVAFHTIEICNYSNRI